MDEDTHGGAPGRPHRHSVGAPSAFGVPKKYGVGRQSGAQPHLGVFPPAAGASPRKNLHAEMSNRAQSSPKPRGGEEAVITP